MAGPAAVASASAAPGSVQVAAGQTLAGIAARYGTTVSGLVAANGIPNPNLIVAGRILRLPTTGAPVTSGVSSSSSVRVAAGQTLAGIAARYGTTVSGLVAANGIPNPNLIVAGRILRLPTTGAPVTSGVSSSSSVRVVAGQTLAGIAARYGTTVSGLVAANGIPNPNLIVAGRILRLPTTGAPVTSSTTPSVTGLPSYLQGQPNRLALRSAFVKAAHANGIPASLLEALCWWESGWQASVVSPTGAVGICQIEPTTAAYINAVLIPGGRLSVRSPVDNITMAALYLHELLVGASGREDVAIGSYYQGLTSVQRHGMLPETRTYVNGIRAYVPLFGGGQ